MLAGCAKAEQASPTDSASMPNEAAPNEPAPLIATFVVMSDTHIAYDRERNQEHFLTALSDIAGFERRPDAIVIVGDITDVGNPDEYELVRRLCKESGFDFDTDFVKVMGNHDQLSASYPDTGPSDETYYTAEHRLFMEQTGVSDVYYDLRLNGLHFIVLGPDALSSDWVCFNFTTKQMNWLDELLAADAAAGETSFVFCHEPLHGTVRGSMEGSWGWANSLLENDELASIMDRYAHTIYFSGHTHVYPDVQRPNPAGALYVNDGAVATGQLSPETRDFATGFIGAFGWLVSVYGDRIEFAARDFLEHAWCDDAQYSLELV